jgi:hypothetical protein
VNLAFKNASNSSTNTSRRGHDSLLECVAKTLKGMVRAGDPRRGKESH